VTSAAPVAPSKASTVTAGDGTPGTLTVNGNVTWNPQTNFFVNLAGDVQGTNYGLLMVNGNVNLGGANLTGLVDPTYAATVFTVGHTYDVLESTGPISGLFAQGGDGAKVFLGAAEFKVFINNNGALKRVTLFRVQTVTSTTVTVAPATGVPNTPFAITTT